MTDNTNLPRLDNNASNRNTAFGGLQIFVGTASFIVFLVFLILRHTIFSPENFFLKIIMWVMIIISVSFFSIGFERMSTNGNFRRIQHYLNGGDFTIEKMSELTGLSSDKLLKEISIMNRRKYWRNVTVLEDALVIEPLTTSNGKIHKIFASEGMRFETAQEGTQAPHALVLIVLLAAIAIFPLPLSNWKWLWLVLAVIVSVPLKKLSAKLTSKKTVLRYNKIPQHVPDKIKLEFSGDEQADALITEGQKHLEELAQLEISIKDEHLNKRIKEISVGTKQMLEKLKQSPSNFSQVRQTMNYSLPTAIELFHKYRELEAHPIKGDNINRSIAKIHEMSDLVSSTFERELNALYQDQTLDIEVDIEVMKNMMQEEAMEIPTLTEVIAKDASWSFPDNPDNPDNKNS